MAAKDNSTNVRTRNRCVRMSKNSMNQFHYIKRFANYLTLFSIILFWSTFIQAKQQSWKYYLGKDVNLLLNEVGAYFECEKTSPITYTLKVERPDGFNEIQDWYTPAGGGFVQTGYVSKTIFISKCSLDKNVQLTALVNNNRVFTLLIKYHNCQRFNCGIQEAEFDKKILESVSVPYIYDISSEYFVNEAEEEKSFNEYNTLENRMKNKSVSTNKYFKVINCRLIGIEKDNRYSDLKSRCGYQIEMEKTIWHAITFIEFYKESIFGNKIDHRLVTRQEFTVIEHENAARNEYYSEIMGIYKMLETEKNKTDSKNDIKKKWIKSVN